MNLQDIFLNQVRKDRIPVTVFLTNGFRMNGIVKGFDSYAVIMESEGRQQFIYKHAISTISPEKRVNIMAEEEKNGD